MNTEQSKVMVIGGGIAGLTAALAIADSGVAVELVEKAAFLGGHAIQYACKATDTCQQCDACTVEKMLKNVVEHPGITIRLGAEVAEMNKNGRFTVSLSPVSGNSSHAGGDDRVSLSAASITALPATGNESPDDCRQNPIACQAQRGFSKNNAAVVNAGAEATLDVDAVVLASGFAPFDAARKGTYGFGKWPNVITGHELEKIKRANGKVVRPSDGRVPEKVAFIQCVGSRDERLGNPWCSKVCCPYALRTAMSMKHKRPETEITLFYMDIQNTGNGFPAFYDQCRANLNFVRNIPVDVYPMENDRLRMRFMEDETGTPVDAEFDLLVLSVGIMPGTDNPVLSGIFDLELNPDGFFATRDGFNPTLTGTKGVFLAGTVQGPKSIANSMAHAGQSACEVIKYLGVA